MHNTACEKRSSSFGAFLLTKISQTKKFPRPVKKKYLNIMSLFSYDPANPKSALVALPMPVLNGLLMQLKSTLV